MEKLQSAIAKARSRRGQDAANPEKQGPSKTLRPLDKSVEDRWEQLNAITLDDAVLVKNRVVSLHACAEATPFDILRTKLQLLSREHGWKRIAITSPGPKSGKTTTACNLITGFSRQKELRAMLFDVDMRRPAIHQVMGLTATASLADVLSGRADFADQALRIGRNAAISLTPRPEDDPTPLLMREQTNTVLDAIEEEYQPDIMLFDMPPFLYGDDTRAFLKNVDCAVVVAAAGASKTSDIAHCEKEIAQHTNIAGIVMNFCLPTSEAAESNYYSY